MGELVKRLGWTLLALILLGAGAAAASWNWVSRYFEAPLRIVQPYALEVAPGSNLRTVLAQLAQDQLLAHPQPVRWYARSQNLGNKIQAGSYTLEPGMTPADLLEQLSKGAVDLVSVRVIEGWTAAQAVEAIISHPEVENDLQITLERRADGIAYLTPEAHATLAEILDIESGHIEGWLYPDTFRFAPGTRASKLIALSHRMMVEELDAAWQVRVERDTLPAPLAMLTLASIVEKETSRPDERAKIAGVFELRLQKGMRLQTDPTVIYGVGQRYDGDIRRRDLNDQNAYNTYQIGGLPPTPIALPGRDALLAVAEPEVGEALFFVANGDGDGSHVFSKTSDEHEAAVREYLRKSRSRGN